MILVTPNFSAPMLKAKYNSLTMKLSHAIFLVGLFFSIALYAQPQSIVTGACLYGIDDSGLIQNGFKLDSVHVFDTPDIVFSRMSFSYNNSGNLCELCIYNNEATEKHTFHYSDRGKILKHEICYSNDSFDYTIFAEPSEYDEISGRPSAATFYYKTIKSNGTVELLPVIKYEVEGYSNNHLEGLSVYSFEDGEWIPSGQDLFSYNNRGLVKKQQSADVEINEGSIRFIVTVRLSDYEYDNHGNILKIAAQEGVIIYYADGTQKEIPGESGYCSFENGYDENGMLMYQIEIDENGNEVSTTYYYWSKADGTSIELPIVDSSVSAPYYEINGRQIVGDVSHSGRIVIHNGKKLLIHP